MEMSDDVKQEVVEDVVEQPASVQVDVKEESLAEKLARDQRVSVEDAEKALNSGYNPNKSKDDDDFKSIREYNRIGELLEKFEGLSKQLKQKDAMLDKIMGMYKKKDEIAYEKAFREITAQKQDAVAEGDIAKYNKLEAAQQLAQQEYQELQQAAQVDPNQYLVQAWEQAEYDFTKRNNGWYNSDSFDNAKLVTFTKDYVLYLANKFPQKDPHEILRDAELEVIKRHPNHPAFRNKARDEAPKVLKSEEKSAMKTDNLLDSLTVEEQKVYKYMRSRLGDSYTEKEFLADRGVR